MSDRPSEEELSEVRFMVDNPFTRPDSANFVAASLVRKLLVEIEALRSELAAAKERHKETMEALLRIRPRRKHER